jgi:SsrA-binding protein
VSKQEKKVDGVKHVATNRKALFNYHVEEHLEVGIALMGSEVKSLRDGKVQLLDAYAIIERGEVWLLHMHIGEYANAGYAGHSPIRARKLLLHRKEIEKLARKVEEKGYTLIPLELYFKRGRLKVKLGLCKGKQAYDKRASIKERDEQRAARRDED